MSNEKEKNHNADFNNDNKGTSGENETFKKRRENEEKMKDPNYIKQQQEDGKIESPKKK